METYHPEFKIVGNASTEEKEKANRELKNALFNNFESLPAQEQEILKKLEYPKTQEELIVIDFANKETNRLMVEVGVRPYNIPTENYRIVSPELYKKVTNGGNAITFYSKQGMLFDANELRNNTLRFGKVALHETLHLKGYLVVEIEEIENEKDKKEIKNTNYYRTGITIHSTHKQNKEGKEHRHLTGLHEAIVSRQEQQSFGNLLDLPIFVAEKDWMTSDEAKKAKEKISKKENIPVNEVIWVDKKNENNWQTISYREQKHTLDYICDEIQKEFSEEYQNSDEVFKEFLKAQFTGHLLTIARLVDKTFGEGSFRILGNMDTDKQSGIVHFETFKKLRLRQVKKEEKNH